MNDKELLAEIKGKEFYRQAGEGKFINLMLPLKSIYSMKEVYGTNFPWCIGIVKDGSGEWWWDKNGMKSVGHWFVEQQRNDPTFITRIEKNWQHARQDVKNCIEKIKDNRYKDACAAFKDLTKKAEEAWKQVIFIDAFDVDGEEIIQKEAGADVAALTVPYELSYTQRQELSLLKIAHALKQGKNVQKQLKTHAQSFYWYKNSYAFVEKFDEKYFLKEAKKIAQKSKKEIKKEMEDITTGMKEQQRQCEKLIASLPTNARNIIHFFRKLSNLRDQRKATHVELIVWMKLLIGKIATHIPENLNQFIVYDEIDDMHDPEFIVQLKAREKGVLAGVTAQQGFFVMTGKEGESVTSLFHDTKTVEQLSGRIAYAGNVRGIVKVVNTAADFGKLKKSEILVAPMTRPDYFPLMKRCAAIVTDEGGITSHAAIVARELKKPCIIGTHNATKVLKDGDMVEVDANKGVVRKLS